ncbi:MAG: cysteine hydrolase family protein [Thiolinea sp.]
MTEQPTVNRQLIEGRPALIVIDILESSVIDKPALEKLSIPHMPDYAARMRTARKVVDKAHECGIPVIFIQEVHRPDLIDFGRELDGSETIHCLENNPMTEVAKEAMGYRDSDYIVKKRRYSAFFATDLEILLKGLKVDTLLLCGGLTDVCVHYTFVDGHQHDYFCRVIEDCVAGSDLAAHEASLKAMEYLQTGARCSLPDVLRAIGRIE